MCLPGAGPHYDNFSNCHTFCGWQLVLLPFEAGSSPLLILTTEIKVQAAVALSHGDSYTASAQTQRICVGLQSDFKHRLDSTRNHQSEDTGHMAVW